MADRATYLKVVDAAKILDVPRQQIYDAIKLGELPAVRVGQDARGDRLGSWRVKKRDFKEFVECRAREENHTRLGTSRLMDRIMDNRMLLMDSLKEKINSLPERERRVIYRRYGLDGERPATLRELGDELEISRERVRGLEKKAIETLAERK